VIEKHEDMKYDIDMFIEKCCKLDCGELLVFVLKECEINEKQIKGECEDLRYKYYKFVHEVAYLIQYFVKPIGMSDEDFMRTKPILENIAKQIKNETILKIYQ